MRTYTTQSANGRFRSPYDDHAYGVSAEFGATLRADEHIEGALRTIARRAHGAADQPPDASDAQLASRCRSRRRTPGRWRWRTRFTSRRPSTSWAASATTVSRSQKPRSSTPRAACSSIRRAAPTAFNWQGAVIWRYTDGAEVHASVSDRARFPVHLRAVQHALRHRDAESGSRAGARDQRRAWMEGTAARAFGWKAPCSTATSAT